MDRLPGAKLRLKRTAPLIGAAAVAAAGLLYYLVAVPGAPAEAQALPEVNNVSELSQNASKGLRGSYQQHDYGGGYYKLWQYRNDTQFYIDQNECDAKDDGNETPNEALVWERAGGGPSENFNDVTQYQIEYVWRGVPPYQWQEEVGFVSGSIDYCGDRNMRNLGDNLSYDSGFPKHGGSTIPHYTRSRGGAPRTPSAHDWNTSGLTATSLEGMEPFYAIGVTPGGAGFDSPELELNLWLPEENIGGALALEVSEFCSHNHWDYETTTSATSHWTDSLLIEVEGSTSTLQYNCSAIGSTGRITIANIESALGEPLDEEPFITYGGGLAEETLYARYLVRAKITADAVGSVGSYTNQFRLKVAQPASGYLGIAKTKIEPGVPENALGVGMRLPGGDLKFRRLKILWEMDIYVAIDPEKACHSDENAGLFGIFDADYPAQPWLSSQGYPPSLQIYQTDRNDFLDGNSPTWVKPGPGNADETHETLVNSGGHYTFTETAQNVWDTYSAKFEGDKIYRFHFYNLDQRSWMQIGIPFNQANSLRKCIKKPLVKVYHGGISAGGQFGDLTTSKTCEEAAYGTANIYGQWVPNKQTDASSAEYGLYARGEVLHFYSGFKRDADPPSPHNRLTFANLPASGWGQEWTSRLRCMPNWWRRVGSLKDPPSTADTLDLSTSSSDLRQLRRPASGTLSLETGGGADLNRKAILYVEGDLLIKENIVNPNLNLEKTNQIRSVYLIVQGDILIEPAVAQIDAVLIAMPTAAGEKGRVFTCYVQGLVDDSSVDLHSYETVIEKSDADRQAQNVEYSGRCDDEKLVINGAVAGRQIRFGRMTDPADDDYVREEINLLPEYYVGGSLLPAHTDWFYTSDSLTVLPVNF